ncbi:heterokaryon incompatibility protein-domain-containing protein [Podospora didyma]|uniref:Heterokaryon incompatibility protein-domain-containing protein n=1 Tax=Podospora didyma TaxID=330526 RepID=A0AAE0K6F9_9PEZI|nr:heterokaryon incompatibility protein-domain-containing protein [Podospora didyma]
MASLIPLPLSPNQGIYRRLDDSKKEIRLLTFERPRRPWLSRLEQWPLFWVFETLRYKWVSFFDADRSRPIRCRLESFPLADAPPYVGLSYVWGDPGQVETIVVNGEDVLVTENLFLALRRIRRRDWEIREVDKLWVDAICINQRDNEEKRAQVSLMREVYAESQGVYMWIGDDEQDFAMAKAHCTVMKLAHQTFNALSQEQQRLFNEEGGLNNLLEYLAPFNRIFYGSSEARWKALENLLDRPYWSRAWILQEFVLAPVGIILCGSKFMSVELLVEATAAWRLMMHTENRIPQKIASYFTGRLGNGLYPLFVDMKFDKHFRDHYAGDPDRLLREVPVFADEVVSNFYTISRARSRGGLLELMISAQDLKTSNPLDRAYALLGLLPPERTHLQPDYSRGPLQLYVDITVEEARHSGSLAYVSAGGVGHRGGSTEDTETLIKDLPSWAADFRHKVRALYLEHPFVPHVPEFKSAQDIPADYRFLGSNTILEAKGIICDRIVHMGKPLELFQPLSTELGMPRGGILQAVLQDANQITNDFSREATEWLRNCLETLPADLRVQPESHNNFPWRSALLRTLCPQLGYMHLLDPEAGKEHCHHCGAQLANVALGFMLLMAEIGAADDLECMKMPAGERARLSMEFVQRLYWEGFLRDAGSHEPCPGHLFTPEGVNADDEPAADYMNLDLALRYKRTFALMLIGNVACGGQFFVTEKGFYGTSEAAVRVGDEAAVLLGCPVPLVVRRLSGSDFVVVGDSHVFGMMYGEMIDDMESWGFKFEVLRFR